jgi:single-strand DNA-binding protein
MRIKVEGRLREFEYKVDGTDQKVPGYQIIADEVTLCLNRIESVAVKPKREATEGAGATV